MQFKMTYFNPIFRLSFILIYLVIFQFSVSVVLITAVLVLYKQIEFTQNKNIGYNILDDDDFDLFNFKVCSVFLYVDDNGLLLNDIIDKNDIFVRIIEKMLQNGITRK